MPLLVPPSNLGVFNPSLSTRRVFTQAGMEFRMKNPSGSLSIVSREPFSRKSGIRDKDRLDRAGGMSVEAMVQTMIDDLTAALGDAVKHDKGNAAAGTRVRKAMQAAKAAAQDVRAKVQADKNA